MSNIYRRNKIWWGCAIRQGRKYRRSLKTANREIAERRLRQWLDELEAIAWGDKPRRTFEETTERFVRDHLTTLKPRGAERYFTSLKHLAAYFDGKTLDQIKSAQLSEFESKRRGDGASAGTMRRDLACLSSVFTSAIDWEWIDDGSNPVPSYLRRRAKRGLKEAPARTRYLSVEEEAQLIAAASPANLRNKNGRQAGKWTCCREAIIVAIDTGLRRDELFGLTWKQVDHLRGLIDTGTKTKSGRARKVPLPSRTAQILAHLPRALDSDFVFINPDTGTRYVQLNRGLKAAMRRAKITDLCWHDLRHTAGCRWLQRDGRSMDEVSILLGHSSVAVTEARYAFLDAEAVARAVSFTKSDTGTADIVPIKKVRQ
jgi:integrase